MAKRLLRLSVKHQFLNDSNYYVIGIRNYSSRNERHYNVQDHNTKVLEIDNEELWMKSTLGNLAPVHKRFPFPGCIGPSQLCFTYPVPLLGIPHFVALDFKLPISGFDRYLSVLQECAELANSKATDSIDETQFDYVAYECPALFKKELVDYYSHLGNIHDCGTIILVRYRVMSTDPNTSVTKQNEASEVDEINENITAQNNLFISAACKICSALSLAGFWTDFVEPSSGELFLSGSKIMAIDGKLTLPRKPLTTQRGFDISRFGACRVIGPFKSTVKRRKFSYAGFMLTVAPRNHPIIENLTSGKGV